MAEEKHTKLDDLKLYSDFNKAQEQAEKFLGEDAILFASPKIDKKYRIYNPNNGKWVDFGQMGYEDFTKHKDPIRRERYLQRATKMKGNWAENAYSPNNLSIHILW
jgi:hypothetical protein